MIKSIPSSIFISSEVQRRVFLLSVFLFVLVAVLSAQEVELFGKIVDDYTDEPIEFATVYAEDMGIAADSDSAGNYMLSLPAKQEITIRVSRIGYARAEYTLPAMSAGSRRLVNFALVPDEGNVEVLVRGSKIDDEGMIRERVESLKLLPSASGNFESILPHIALGTYGGSGGELSSQYNVRGGNYDENLVYVNDFEIYRPQLIRSGQQEGLSFPNMDLASNLVFSSGGFQAKYGDKLSSVLDISYKRPDSLKGSAELSLLGGAMHLEGSVNSDEKSYRSFKYLLGARYKTTSYLLNTLDVEGEYTPNFADVQAYLTYDFHPDWQLGWLTNYNRSVYHFEPTERSTAFGQVNYALELSTAFEGAETDDFEHSLSGLSLTYLPDRDRNPFYLKCMASYFDSRESESFDIRGYYRLSEIETDFTSEDAGEEVNVLGQGVQQEYTRNILHWQIAHFKLLGGKEWSVPSARGRERSHFLQWGVKVQREWFDDRINEWERLDSAGYSLPYDPDAVRLERVFKSENELAVNRLEFFAQNTYTWKEPGRLEGKWILGFRGNYRDLNEEFLFSPRTQLLLKPLDWEEDMSFKLSGGLYAQPPFYREMRRPDGSINRELKAQKSLHVVGGMTWDFLWEGVSDKPFRFIAEAYYKRMWDLVSYEIDNVRIRYSGENDATGYAVGLDMRLNGEFVPDAESWINLSLLRARERLDGVTHLRREVGEEEAEEVETVARPTDQLVSLSVFFQDYLPNNDRFKMYLNLAFGSGLPFGLKGNNRVYRNTYRFKPYHRIDIGFSYVLWDPSKREAYDKSLFRFSRAAWIRLEVFNLMQVANEASNTWIKTVFKRQYAVPNYLTSRRINLRIHIDF